MKQLLQNFKTGEVSVEDVPAPILRKGCVIVRNHSSLISVGTEGGTVKLGKKSLIGKARARPEQVKKVMKAFQSEGVIATISAVNKTLDLPIPLGYSCAGVVDQLGEGVSDLKVGDRVACGGGGMAFHAGVVVIPRNLCVPIPTDVSFNHAAFTTVGSIAMQGVRVGTCNLGDNVVVVGLGLVGLLTAEILKAAGCNVIGVDISKDRCDWAERNGICKAAPRGLENIEEVVLEATDGFGADKIIITAAVESNDPIALAGRIARYKGIVVVVGRTVMEAPRETFLFKELELRTSLAYGPGTGDDTYEQEGYDYPIGYVRWTENRNMQCFVELVAQEKIKLDPLITHSFPIEQGRAAFDLVINGKENCIGVILNYGEEANSTSKRLASGQPSRPAGKTNGTSNVLRTAVIGSGSFATNIMLPILHKRTDIDLSALVSSTGFKAAGLAKKYNIPLISSDAEEVLESESIDCVFIFTRHGTHARFAEAALLSGKHVFVEKPLAMTMSELDAVVAAQKQSEKVLMVGFNRRFSPLAIKMKRFFQNRCQPMVINFRGNVGYRPPEHWLHDPEHGGGVIIGEACHYIDFCRWMVDSPIAGIDSRCVGASLTSMIPEDNCTISLYFEDGSLATITYVSNGSTGFGREYCEANAEGKTAVWEDFNVLKMNNNKIFSKYKYNLFPQKGFKEEIEFFVKNTKLSNRGMQTFVEMVDSSRSTIIANKLRNVLHDK